jgi:glycosyltransferase involved in cell wall biosynthesis
MARICMIAYTLYTSDPRVRREAEALAARGDTVDFICVREPGLAQEYHGVRLYPLTVGKYQGERNLSYVLKYASFFLKAFFLVTWLFFKKRYQIIQVHTMPDFLVFAAAIPKLFGAKVVLDVHDLMPELYMSKFKATSRHPIIRILRWTERRSIAFAHRAIAVHQPHLQALASHGNPTDKFGILLNVPDPRIFHRNGAPRVKPGSRFRMIYHGTVAPRHGLEVALKATARVKAAIPELEFVVIGGGDDLDRIKALAIELGLQSQVRFLGRMPVEQLPHQLSHVDVGLVPILYDDFTRYMLPLKLMEYVGMGIPAIVSRTETIKAYFDDEMVQYVSPGDERELAEAILELHRDPEKRARLVTNAETFNARYRWDEHKKSYFQLLDSLLPAARN